MPKRHGERYFEEQPFLFSSLNERNNLYANSVPKPFWGEMKLSGWNNMRKKLLCG
jgi:hypothetical protein